MSDQEDDGLGCARGVMNGLAIVAFLLLCWVLYLYT
jgi:hypothetical protein